MNSLCNSNLHISNLKHFNSNSLLCPLRNFFFNFHFITGVYLSTTRTRTKLWFPVAVWVVENPLYKKEKFDLHQTKQVLKRHTIKICSNKLCCLYSPLHKRKFDLTILLLVCVVCMSVVFSFHRTDQQATKLQQATNWLIKIRKLKKTALTTEIEKALPE